MEKPGGRYDGDKLGRKGRRKSNARLDFQADSVVVISGVGRHRDLAARGRRVVVADVNHRSCLRYTIATCHSHK